MEQNYKDKVVESALKICADRASAFSDSTFDETATYYRLRGILEREGEEAVFTFARTAKVPRKQKKYWQGNSYVEIRE